MRASASSDTPVTVPTAGGTLPLGELKARYFVESPGSRVTYVTDTAWSENVRPSLLRLASKRRRCYCDSFYAAAQNALAEKYRHMTATQAAEFARDAGVAELVLIHFAARYKGHYDALSRRLAPSSRIPPPRFRPAVDKKSERTANHS